MENITPTLIPLLLVLALAGFLLYRRKAPQGIKQKTPAKHKGPITFEKVTMCLTEADQLFFIRQKKALRDLGFQEIADFTLPGRIPDGYYRAFHHPNRPIYAVLAHIFPRRPDQYLVMFSRFTEGPALVSDNRELADDGKRSRFQRIPGAKADELLTYHEKMLKELIEGGTRVVPTSREGFFLDFAELLISEALTNSGKSPRREEIEKELAKVPPVDFKFFLKPLPPPPAPLPEPEPAKKGTGKLSKPGSGKLAPPEKREQPKAEQEQVEKKEKPAKPERRWTRPSELKKAAEEAAEDAKEEKEEKEAQNTEKVEAPKVEEVKEKQVEAAPASAPEVEPFDTPTLLKFIPSEEDAAKEETLIRFDQIPVDGGGTLPFDSGEPQPFDAPTNVENAENVEDTENAEKKAESPEEVAPKPEGKTEKNEEKPTVEPKKGPTRMKAPDQCPACGEPVLSPLASYCRKCKAYLRGEGDQ